MSLKHHDHVSAVTARGWRSMAMRQAPGSARHWRPRCFGCSGRSGYSVVCHPGRDEAGLPVCHFEIVCRLVGNRGLHGWRWAGVTAVLGSDGLRTAPTFSGGVFFSKNNATIRRGPCRLHGHSGPSCGPCSLVVDSGDPVGVPAAACKMRAGVMCRATGGE